MKGNCKILIASFLFLCSCKPQTQMEQADRNDPSLADYFKLTEPGVQDGGVRILEVETPKGKFNVWTKQTGNNPDIKVLLLAGGPGISHEYLECFESFLPAAGIQFYYYDQLGTGHSDNPVDMSLWDLDRFVEEVEQVRTALGLDSTNFFLFGHSWGAILGMQYAMKYQEQLKGLIVSNMMASAPEYGKYADEVLAKQMDPAVLSEIHAMEEKKEYENPRFMELLMNHYYSKHICRIPIENWPEPMTRAFSSMNQPLYTVMQGPSEFGISGKLEKWDLSGDLEKISVPVLVIGAKYDTMDPEYMKWMSGRFPKGSYLYCEKGSHMSMYDDQQTYMSGTIDWLKKNVVKDAGK